LELFFQRVCIAGVGLIGGSLALGMRQQKLVREIIGVGRGEENLKLAKELGIIDDYTHQIEQGVEQADLVVLATPVRVMPELVKKAQGHFRSGAILTDVGSTKKELIEKILPLLDSGIYFVPAHPIAGREKTGARYSDPDLFKGRWTIITPCPRSSSSALEKIKLLWSKLGSKVEMMEPDFHDQVLAWISHLPHMVAYALVGVVMEKENEVSLLRFSAGGFRDFIRIAGSSPEMWRDICLENKQPILETIARYQKELELLAQWIEEERAEELEEYFAKTRTIKEKVEKNG